LQADEARSGMRVRSVIVHDARDRAAAGLAQPPLPALWAWLSHVVPIALLLARRSRAGQPWHCGIGLRRLGQAAMDVYLPIANLAVNGLVIVGLAP
jgi:hypothetical protein